MISDINRFLSLFIIGFFVSWRGCTRDPDDISKVRSQIAAQRSITLSTSNPTEEIVLTQPQKLALIAILAKPAEKSANHNANALPMAIFRAGSLHLDLYGTVLIYASSDILYSWQDEQLSAMAQSIKSATDPRSREATTRALDILSQGVKR